MVKKEVKWKLNDNEMDVLVKGGTEASVVSRLIYKMTFDFWYILRFHTDKT